MKNKKKLVLHNLILRECGGYSAICLELNVATQGDTRKEAEANIKEAVELYLESVYEYGDEKDAIPRPADPELWLKYFTIQEKKLRSRLKGHLEEGIEYLNAVGS